MKALTVISAFIDIRERREDCMKPNDKLVSDLQKMHEADLERIKKFRLLDDDFMSKVFEDSECAEILLKIILNRDDLKVQDVHVQHVIHNLQGRSIRLDIYAVDLEGKLYDIEIQRDDKGAGVKRARYNSSLLSANATDTGEEYNELRETYVIFITENDVLKGNLPIYHIERVILENGELFYDEEHIIYVNSRIVDETTLGRLMHDFWCTDAGDMYNTVLANRVRYFKEDVKGVEIMCKEMEKMRDETRKELIIESIRKMLKARITEKQIKQVYDVTDDEIEKIKAEVYDD